ncbi:MAG: histidine phosphatase family protein [Amylibacter sp.]|nr:histidine phosphatase family protein [Amylibacter sp.]
MKLPTLYLLRHGQTEWNEAGRFQGQMNSDLTDVGKGHAAAQGRLLGPIFEQFPDIDIYGSPLGRVRETAHIALADHGREPVLCDELKEISVGDWEGCTKLEIEFGWPIIYNESQTSLDMFLSAPNGETYDDMFQRCHRLLSRLTGPSMIFSHGVTIRFLRKIACDLSYEELTYLDNQQGCIYEIKDGQETLLTEAE